MDNYFSRFPVISYNNTAILDISRRVSINPADASQFPTLFYPTELKSGMRPDILADAYYGNAEQDWLIYLANQTVDPYYWWYLTDDEFNSYILDKYGGIEFPKQKIKFYRNNWANDDTQLTPSFYNNTLSLDQKQYYNPIFGAGAKIVSYSRKRDDWTTNTNKIFQYTYTAEGGFTDGELVQIHSGDSIAYPADGQGEVVTSNSSALIVQNISGNSTSNSTWIKTIYGEVSNTVATANLSVTLKENITEAEAVFWSSVSYFDWEVERNESRKFAFLINPSMAMDTSNQIRNLVSNT